MHDDDAEPKEGRGSLFRGRGPDMSGWYMPTGEASAVAAGAEELARIKGDDVLGDQFGLALNAVVRAAADAGAEEADVPRLAREHYRALLAGADVGPEDPSGDPPAQADRAADPDE